MTDVLPSSPSFMKPDADFDLVQVSCRRCRSIKELQKQEYFLIRLLFDLEHYLCPVCTSVMWPHIMGGK